MKTGNLNRGRFKGNASNTSSATPSISTASTVTPSTSTPSTPIEPSASKSADKPYVMDEQLRALLSAASNFSNKIGNDFHEADEEESARQKRLIQRSEAAPPPSPGKKKKGSGVAKPLTAAQKRKIEADDNASIKRAKIVDEDKASAFEQPATVTVSPRPCTLIEPWGLLCVVVLSSSARDRVADIFPLFSSQGWNSEGLSATRSQMAAHAVSARCQRDPGR